MKELVLKHLKKEQDYCSGEEISHKLGVTRAAVWKAIKKLQEEGYQITSSTRKGYKLIVSPNVITASEVKDELQTKIMGQEIIYYEAIDSTNNEAKKKAREGASEGTLIIADQQTAGKGRLGRSWISPSGEGIWMSLILRPHILPNQASQLTLIAGLGMCEAIERVTGLKAQIKWPNDVVVNSKKICGILTEMSAQVEQIEYVVVGIGVNVNLSSIPEELPYASSLAIEGGKEYSRKKIIATFLEIFEVDYTQYVKSLNLNFIKERYEQSCITLHRQVKLITKENECIAKALGINEEGALMAQMQDGSIQTVSSGEVSVRGLYGYID